VVHVVEILHAAVGEAEMDHRLHLLGDDGLARVDADPRSFQVREQHRVVRVDGVNRIAEPDVDLH
jgi:hypothetical protein